MRDTKLLRQAQQDVLRGFFFYEGRERGLGQYFQKSMEHDIEQLSVYFGKHSIHFGFHRALCNAFPYAIYYRDLDDNRQIVAILDMRQSPSNIRSILTTR